MGKIVSVQETEKPKENDAKLIYPLDPKVMGSDEKQRLAAYMSSRLNSLSKKELEVFCTFLRTSPSFRHGTYFNREKKPDEIYDAMIDIALIHPSANGRSLGKDIVRNCHLIRPDVVERALERAESNLTSMFSLGMVWGFFERYADSRQRNEEVEKMLLRLFKSHLLMMKIPRNRLGYSVLLDATDTTKKAMVKIITELPDSAVAKELEKSLSLLRKYSKDTHFSSWRVEELLREMGKS
jgi:predicted transcriptional regulator